MKTKNRKKIKRSKKANIPKYFWGALLSTGLSAVTSVLGNKKAKEQVAMQEERNRLLAESSALQQDRAALEHFQPEGFGDVNYYNAKGGKLASPSYNTKGGELISVSSDMEMVEGNTHEQNTIDNTTGVKLLNENNKPFAEVEDDEAIKDGEKVYSNQLIYKDNRTYADEAKRLAKKKAKAEKNLNSTDVYIKGTAERQLLSLDKKENELFAHQENSKQNNNIMKTPKKLKKGGLAKFLNNAAPYFDNVVNAFLTLNTPKVPKPIIQNPANLKTTYNANPALKDVDDAVNASTKFIENNTSNSAAARANITATRLKGGTEKARIRAHKDNVETQMHNVDAMNRQQVNANNLAKVDKNNQMNMMRHNDIQTRISDNVANLSEDFANKKQADIYQKYHDERSHIAAQMYNDGTTRRAMLKNPSELMKVKEDETYRNMILEKFAGTPEEAQLKLLLGITD